jgi:hypothetical protein
MRETARKGMAEIPAVVRVCGPLVSFGAALTVFAGVYQEGKVHAWLAAAFGIGLGLGLLGITWIVAAMVAQDRGERR